MKKYLVHYIGVIVFFLMGSFSHADVVWEENFDDSAIDQKGAIGSTIDMTDVTKWSIDVSSADLSTDQDWFSVQNQKFEARDLDGEAIWESEEINITDMADIVFELNASEEGDIEGGNDINTDYMDIYYSIDSGDFQRIPNWNNLGSDDHTLIGDEPDDDDWNATIVSQSIGTGHTSLKIRVVMKNNAGGEYLRIDDVVVTTSTTLPVTISYAYPLMVGSTLELDFTTATETSNIGFNIYALKGDVWTKLNREIIPGALDSLVPVSYHASLSVPDGMKIGKIGIAGVDVNGQEDRHGPFEVGKENGVKTVISPVQWGKVRKAYNANKKSGKDAGVMKRKSRRAFVSKAVNRLLKEDTVNLKVSKSAVYRITHEDLLSKEIDLTGIKAKYIAVSFKGQGVPRTIANLNKRGRWTEESYIEFRGEKPKGADALYLDSSNYQLSLDKNLVVKSEAIEPGTAKELVFEDNNKYSWTSPGEDPFYDVLFYTRGEGKPGTVIRTLEISSLPTGKAEMTVYVSGFSKLEHHLAVSLNGSEVAEVRQSGYAEIPIRIALDPGILVQGENVLTITALGYKENMDVFTYDKTVLRYDDGRQNAILRPEIAFGSTVHPKDIRIKRDTNYLIIAHPMFIGKVLEHYVEQKESEGWRIQVVSVEDIYEAYGYGMATPEAIRAYLDEAKRGDVTHVQLVGAASYDYKDYLGLGSVSFIPSIYVHTGALVHYTPCDSCLVADSNGLPELAIGRWPVRTLSDLESVINKTLAWRDSGQSASHTALMIADEKEKGANFSQQMDTLAQQFENAPNWNSIEKVYFDEKLVESGQDSDLAAEMARSETIDALNNGVSVVSFSGHSAPTMWSFKRILTYEDAALIDNTGQTALALPLACYTNYADSPSVNTMAHQFLVEDESGFVAIYGAATLSSFTQNGVSAQKVTAHLLQGETIGEAVRNAKRELGVPYMDVVRNSNLLGDVTLKIK